MSFHYQVIERRKMAGKGLVTIPHLDDNGSVFTLEWDQAVNLVNELNREYGRGGASYFGIIKAEDF
jgi:hypothetical protein